MNSPQTGRNDPCSCGSGRKYKKCCLAKDEEAARAKLALEARGAGSAIQTNEPEVEEPEQTIPTWVDRQRPIYGLDALTESSESEQAKQSNRLPLNKKDQELVDQWWEAVDLMEDAEENRLYVHRSLRLTAQLAPDFKVELRKAHDDHVRDEVAWSFTGWARRTKGLSWTTSRFLANALLEYWSWKPDGKKQPKNVTIPFGLDKDRLDHYLTRCCGGILGSQGIQVLSLLQAFHYFTEYLVAHNALSAADAVRWQSAAADLFALARNALARFHHALRLLPTYDALIVGFTKPRTALRLLTEGGTPPHGLS